MDKLQNDKPLYFSFIDYTVFGGMLAISALIGLYFGFISKRKQDNTAEYLMGSKSMKVIPVAISLTATHVSSVTILGVPSEVYQYGTQYWAAAIAIVVVTVIMGFFYLPVFYEQQTITIFAYLENRFDTRMRKFGSGLYTFATVLYMPLMIFAPAIAFSQVTGINLHIITPIMCAVCIFYTMFGGIRAVVWTDTLQFVSMVGALFFIMFLGTYKVGGFKKLFEITDDGGRLILFNMDPDPTIRQSFWMVSIGLTVLWLSGAGVSPECTQRFLTIPTYKKALLTLWLFCFGHIMVRLLAVYCGIVIFARYKSCDPITLGLVKKPDQIFPYYVMDVAREYPGLPGIFIAGVFSAALSSMSSGLNCLSGAIFTDILKPFMPNTTDKQASQFMKVIVFFIGLLSIGLVFIVDKLGSLFSLAISIGSVTHGTLLGMFTLGMAFPKANKQGAFWGSVASILSIVILITGAQISVASNKLKYETLPFRTDECERYGYSDWESSGGFKGTYNSSIHIYHKNFDNSAVPFIFRLGFMYYSLIGTLIVFIVGYPISVLTGGCDDLNEKLLSPVIRRWYLRNNKPQPVNNREMNCYANSVDTKSDESVRRI